MRILTSLLLVLAASACSKPTDESTAASAASDDAYVRIAYLESEDTQTLATKPNELAGQVPDAVIAIAKDRRMVKSYSKLWAAMEDELVETIHTEIYRQGKQLTVYVEGDADDRGDSTWSFVVEYDMSAKKVLSWSAVEFTDHP